MNFYRDNYKIFIFFLFSYLLLLNFYQLSVQHWSSMLDQDIIIIYNSLLISSGIEQENRDHPAYTTFLLLGGVFKFLSLFFENFTIEEVLSSENIDKNLQTLFVIGRILNGFYIFFLSYILFKILNELNIKKNISIIIISSIIFFQDTYELLFLIRSEALSILLVLTSFYYLLKFIKIKNIKYSIISGFFFCLSMLAKIYVIFLFFTFLLSLPFFTNYLNSSKKKLEFKKNNYYLSYIFLITFFAGYLYFQFVLGVTFLKELNDPRYYITHNIDVFFLFIFVIFYSFFIKYLSIKKIGNHSEIVIIISSVLVGFVLCILFVLFLDLINLIPFNKLNLLRLTNPIEYMTDHARIFPYYKGIFTTIKYILFGFGGGLDINFNEFKHQPLILFIDQRIFFRTLQVLFFIFLIYFSIKKIKDNKINYLSISLFIGIFFQYLSINFRETHGYNMYLFPLYIIIAAIIFNKLNKKILLIFLSCISVIFISENLVLSDVHKNSFSREPRVYDICQDENIEITKWKNSENYEEKYNKSSYIKLVKLPKVWFTTYAKKIVPTFKGEDGKLYMKKSDDKFFKRYCNQIKNEKSSRSHSYKLKTK